MGGSFSIVPEGNDTEVTVMVVPSPDGQQQPQASPSQYYPQPRKNYYHDGPAPYGAPYQYGQPPPPPYGAPPGYPGYGPGPYGAPPPPPPPNPYGDPYMTNPYGQYPPYGAPPPPPPPQYGQPYGYPQGQPPPPPPNPYGGAPAAAAPLTFKLVGVNQSPAKTQAPSATVVTPTPSSSDNARSASAIGDKIADQVWEKIQKKQQQKQQQQQKTEGSKSDYNGSMAPPPGGAPGTTTPGSKVSKVPSNFGPPSPSAILKVNRPTSSSSKNFDDSDPFKMGGGPLVTAPNHDDPGAMYGKSKQGASYIGGSKSTQPFSGASSNSKESGKANPPDATTLLVANYKKSQVSSEKSKSAVSGASGYRSSVRSADASKVGDGGSNKSKRPKSLAMGSSKKPRSASGRSRSTGGPSSAVATSSTMSKAEGSTKSTRTSGTGEASSRKQKTKLERAKAKAAAAGKLGTKSTKTKKPNLIMDSTFFTLPKSTTDVGGAATVATPSKGPSAIPGSSIGCTPSSVGPSERPFPSAVATSSGIGDSSSSSSSSTSKASKPKSAIGDESKKPSSRTSIRDGRPRSVSSVRSNKSLKSIDKNSAVPSVGRWSSISSTFSTSSNKPESSQDGASSGPMNNPDSKKSGNDNDNDDDDEKDKGREVENRKSDANDKKDNDDDDDEEKERDAKMKQQEAEAKKDSTKKRQDPDEY